MKKLMPTTLIAFLTLQALFFLNPSPVYAQGMTCESPTFVTIDVKPGDSMNKINLSAKGLLPVAVLTTTEFDASQFEPEMAHLSDADIAMTMGCTGAMAIRWNLDDVNHDGRLDLVFFFKIQELDLTSSSTAAMLMAHGSYNSAPIHIMDDDSVQVRP
jgi:hypothetical protein